MAEEHPYKLRELASWYREFAEGPEIRRFGKVGCALPKISTRRPSV